MNLNEVITNIKNYSENDSNGTSSGTGVTTETLIPIIIRKPEGLVDCEYNGTFDATKKCSYKTINDTTYKNNKIENITAIINGSLTLKSDKKNDNGENKIQINNSVLYITDAATFGDVNGDLLTQPYI